MATIDNRLLGCDTDQDVTENFNRVLGLIDEGGSTGGGIVLVGATTSETGAVLDLTPNQLYGYLNEGKLPVIYIQNGENLKYLYYINEIEYESGSYSIRLTGDAEFTSDGENTPFSYTQ